jgi:hypothetical protein
MSWHNETCGCAECGNYGQTYNPKAIHNQSCGCAECGNYDYVPPVAHEAKQSQPILNSTDEAKEITAESSPKRRKKAKSRKSVKKTTAAVEMVPVPIELLDEVRALIAKRTHAEPS